MSSRLPLAIIGTAVIAVLVWAALGRSDMPPPVEGDYPRGPHGARLLSADTLQLEITIFETGVPPHFRVYPYDASGAAIDPSTVTLTIDLHRLGDRVDRITFTPEADYLKGLEVVEEPHSFDVTVNTSYAGRSFDWTYASIEGKVRLSDAQLASTGIEIWTIGPKEITTTVTLTGQVVADDTRVAHVTPRLSGTLVSVASQLGQRVARGDVMAVLHSRELADARSAYLAATHHAEFARVAAAREEALWQKKISAEREYLEAKRDAEEAALAETTAAQKLMALGDTPASLKALAGAAPDALSRFEVRAPIDGLVLERDATLGEAVSSDEALFVVGDLSSVFIDAPVDADALAALRVGQSARITTMNGGRQVDARVTYLSPRIDTSTRLGMVRFTINNTDGAWRPGLFVTVAVVDSTVTVPMAVPVDAIQSFRDWQVVFFRFGDWFEARPLELGRSDGQWVEVLSGLSPGDRYAATNSFAIKAEIGKLGATHDH
jgi:cobalt-zinc-cadmium efflux system membrane fusion protein